MNCPWPRLNCCDRRWAGDLWGAGWEDGQAAPDYLEVEPPKRTSLMQRGLGETIIGTHHFARPQAHTRPSRNSMIAACNSASSVMVYARGSIERKSPFSG